VAAEVNCSVSSTRRGSLLLALCFFLALAIPSARAQSKGAPDAECLACHGQPDLKSDGGHSVYVDPARHKASVHGDLACTTCHTDLSEFPHRKKVAQVICATCHEDKARDIPQSVHSVLGEHACTSCHGSAHYAEAAATVMPQQCGTCHSDEVKDFLVSVHGTASKNGGPSCQTCHGPAHKIQPTQDPLSPVAKKNLPDTCGSCHSNPEFVAKHQISFAHPVEAYKLSVHGRAVAAGDEAAASCSDCHSSHAIYPVRDPRARINHWNVPKTCGTCHSEIEKVYEQSIHGQAVVRGAPDSPVCTDCHGEHNILAPSEPKSLVNPARVSTITCGRCHGDAHLNARYNLPTDRVPTFADSYHGLEARAGSQSVANCASCHGVHDIFPSSDPRSTVNPANLPHTCGACHPGAGQKFAIGPVHVGPQTQNESAAVRTVRWFYWVMIPLALGFMFFHHFADFVHKIRARPKAALDIELERMNLHFRIAHWLTVISFPVLVITGFALKFPEAWWAQPVLLWESKFAFRGTLHRIAAVVLLFSFAYHIFHLLLVRRDRMILRYMRPAINDLKDMGDMFRYNLGLAEAPPGFRKYVMYVEKIEYWAFVWGTVIMALTGFLLWFHDFALRYFPKWVADTATTVHYYEAILATFSILIWHMYTVVFDPDVYPMDPAWITGKIPAEYLRHSRPALYRELVRLQRREHKSKEQEQTKEAEGGPTELKPEQPLQEALHDSESPPPAQSHQSETVRETPPPKKESPSGNT
jgi:formate dehydrogenase gamma subunit